MCIDNLRCTARCLLASRPVCITNMDISLTIIVTHRPNNVKLTTMTDWLTSVTFVNYTTDQKRPAERAVASSPEECWGKDAQALLGIFTAKIIYQPLPCCWLHYLMLSLDAAWHTDLQILWNPAGVRRCQEVWANVNTHRGIKRE